MIWDVGLGGGKETVVILFEIGTFTIKMCKIYQQAKFSLKYQNSYEIYSNGCRLLLRLREERRGVEGR